MDILRNSSKEDIIRLVENVPFISYHPQNGHTDEHFKISYENANRLLLVTGIHKEYVESFLTSFNNSSYRIPEMHNIKGNCAKIVHDNKFWVCIEAVTAETAGFLKKYLRNQKRNMDCNQEKAYKIERRRTRIIIVKEELFTLLIDSMIEFKYFPPYKEINNSAIISNLLLLLLTNVRVRTVWVVINR